MIIFWNRIFQALDFAICNPACKRTELECWFWFLILLCFFVCVSVSLFVWVFLCLFFVCVCVFLFVLYLCECFFLFLFAWERRSCVWSQRRSLPSEEREWVRSIKKIQKKNFRNPDKRHAEISAKLWNIIREKENVVRIKG